MSLIRPFEATDILRFHAVNADPWTATYHNGYYASYVAQWPDLCYSVEGAFDGEVRAYSESTEPSRAAARRGGVGRLQRRLLVPSLTPTVIAKDEPAPPDPQHHGHLTALSISPPYRGLGLARVFMAMLERLSSDGSAGWALPPSPTGAGANGDSDADSADAPPDPTDCVDAYFVDLFVRCNNHRAIDMYEKLGYSVYRRVVE